MKNPKDMVRRYRLWKFYRITPEEHDKVQAFQAAHPVYKLLLGRRLGTDHRHSDGLIRGLLEWRLNRVLGMVEHVAPTNVSRVLRALAEYYEHPPAVQALGREVFGLIGQAKVKKKMIYGGPNEQRTKP